MSENIATLPNSELIKRLEGQGINVPDGTKRAELLSMLKTPTGQNTTQDTPSVTAGGQDVDIFGSEPGPVVQEPQTISAPEPEIFSGKENQIKVPDDKIVVEKSMLQDILNQLNELRNKDGAVDLAEVQKRKRLIRVPIYTDEQGKEFLVIGLRTRTSRDGTERSTWERGHDEQKRIITWCDPYMVDLETGVIEESKEINYYDFCSICTTVTVEVQNEIQEPVDMTPKASANEVVEQADYEETKEGFYRRKGTGAMIKVKVWGVKRTFEVNYEGRQYKIQESVVNLK